MSLTKSAKNLSQALKKIGLPLKFLVLLLAISIFSVYSFASNVAVTSAPVQSESGVFFNVDGGFTVTNNGFSIAQNMSAASAEPVKWTNSGICQTALTAGDWFYDLTLTVNNIAQANHIYSVTIMWDTGSGYSTLGVLKVTSPDTIIDGQTMNMYFDTGQSNFNTPAAIKVILQ